MDITELRQEIDRIDTELVQLICNRLDVASKIADYKKENNLPIYHPGREQEVLRKVALLAGSEKAAYATDLYSKMFEISKAYQIAQNKNSDTV